MRRLACAQGEPDDTPTAPTVGDVDGVLGPLPGQTRQSWAALYRARWSTAAAWRMALVAFEGKPRLRSPERVLHFLAVNVQPETVLSVIEALMHERLLSSVEGHAIEESILAHVGRDGDWAPQKEQI